jgi:hypothetical protein
MQRLYQWLSQRASFFRYHQVGPGTSGTTRTETTVRREGMTLFIGNAATVVFDTCPLCGSKLASEQSEQARLRLLQGSISQETGSVDSQPP